MVLINTFDVLIKCGSLSPRRWGLLAQLCLDIVYLRPFRLNSCSFPGANEDKMQFH